jgi:hypothetical protein
MRLAGDPVRASDNQDANTAPDEIKVMATSHVLCTVESFRITREGHGVFGDEIRIEGWFLSHDPLISLDIVFSDGEASIIPVDHIANESEGVWQHHGAIFGDAARSCRFYTARKVPGAGTDMTTARLRAVMQGDVFEMKLGAPANMAVPQTFTPEEGALVMEFESIGDNCEFGLMQRTVGTERMGLLRYAGVYDAVQLANLLDRRFAGFSEGEDLQITTFGPEWIADIRSASLNIHTGRIQGLVTREKIEAEERQKLMFLADKFMDDLETGRKTFVYRTLIDQRGGPDGTYGMDRLYDAVKSYGDCALLWVTVADEDHPHGTVTHVRDRLFRGYIRSLTPYDDAHRTDERAWLDLLSTARDAVSRPAPPVAALTAESALA